MPETAMPKTLSLDIGFNRDLIERPGSNHDLPLLSQGLTKICHEGNPVVVARQVEPGDELVLTIYDLTGSGHGGADIREMSLQLSFKAAVELQNWPSPIVEQSVFESFSIGLGGIQRSTVFGQEYRYFFVDSGGPAYPSNQLNGGSSQKARYPLTIPGHYYFTLQLRVVFGDGEAKIFRVDPEMIVDHGRGGTGGGPDKSP